MTVTTCELDRELHSVKVIVKALFGGRIPPSRISRLSSCGRRAQSAVLSPAFAGPCSVFHSVFLITLQEPITLVSPPPQHQDTATSTVPSTAASTPLPRSEVTDSALTPMTWN